MLVSFVAGFLGSLDLSDACPWLWVCMLALLTVLGLVWKPVPPLPLPPGPKGLPFLGWAPWLLRGGDKREGLHVALHDLAKQYGPVFSLPLGNGRMAVVLADAPNIRDALRQEAFAGRPTSACTEFLGGYGIVGVGGEVWKEQRRFVHDLLREFGAKLGLKKDPNRLEDILNKEVRTLLSSIDSWSGRASDPQASLSLCVGNVISTLLMGVRFESGDVRFARLCHLIDDGFRLFGDVIPAVLIPALRWLPRIRRAQAKLQDHHRQMFAYFRQVVDQHRQKIPRGINGQDTEDPPSPPQDFVDAFLQQMKQAKPDDPKRKYFSERQLYQVLGDLFSSGMESSQVTLQWLLYFVSSHPNVQTRIQQELDQVVGKDRLPTMQDLSHLPYTEATILETQRRANVLAIAPAHATTQSVAFKGYWIPRNTVVLPLLWSVHMDPKVWKDPETFEPARFLNADGGIHRPDNFMPFGTGRRFCLGASLARLEVFLVFTSLLHQFSFRLPADASPSFTPIVATTLRPPPFTIHAQRREAPTTPA